MSVSTGASSKSAKGKKQQEPISYICDNCGAKITTTKEIPKCLGCGKALCEICNNYFLCPQDFHKLKKKDQKKIKKLGHAIENAHNAKIIFTIMPTILGIIGAVLLILMIILRRELLYFLFSFFGGFLLLSAFITFFMFRNFEEREKKRIKLKIRALIIPYNIKRVKQVPQVPIDETKKVAKDEVKTVFCSSCGSEIHGINLKYCEKCGFSLNEKDIN